MSDQDEFDKSSSSCLQETKEMDPEHHFSGVLLLVQLYCQKKCAVPENIHITTPKRVIHE